MRKLLPVLLVLLPLGCSDEADGCNALGDELVEAGEALDRDPSLENFDRVSEANDAWLAARCDSP